MKATRKRVMHHVHGGTLHYLYGETQTNPGTVVKIHRSNAILTKNTIFFIEKQVVFIIPPKTRASHQAELWGRRTFCGFSAEPLEWIADIIVNTRHPMTKPRLFKLRQKHGWAPIRRSDLPAMFDTS